MKMNIDDYAKTSGHSVRNPVPESQNLGGILVGSGKLSSTDIERVMELQRREGWRFGEAALRLRLINEKDLIHALHNQYDLPQFLPGTGPFSEELVAAYQPYHRRTEELRALRTQLLMRWYKRGDSARNVLAVVSPGHGEGRSYVAANLAVLFAQLGERTLLIDADLRNPGQHRIFNAPDRIGLSTVLSGRARADAIRPVAGFRNLRLLPAGAPPPNPLELLSRPALGNLLDEYASDFDVILLDTSPALNYSDAHTVSFSAGNAVVLTRKDHTRVEDTARVVRDLGNSNTNVVGTVLNAC